MPPRPVVGRRAIEVLLQAELPKAKGRRLVLVDAVYEDRGRETEFTVRAGGKDRRIRVTDQDSLLGIAEAWQRHRGENPAGDDVLVVTGQVPADQIGWDLRAQALHCYPQSVDRADIVRQLFGATDLDSRVAAERWLLDALLEAEPVDGGWPRAGAVLTRDRAVRALLAQRLHLGDTASDTLDLDTDTLFAWSRTPHGPASYAALSAAEQDGIAGWFTQAVGPAAATVLALAADGRGQDALPLGALASAALSSTAPDVANFALGTLFGSALSSFEELRSFADAATGVLSRWIARAEGSGPARDEARGRVVDVLEHADRLAGKARLSLGADRLLPSGYRARLRVLADLLDGPAAPAEAALRELLEHQLGSVFADSTETACTAVRLVRWLHTPLPVTTSVDLAVRAHLASSGWTDLAVGILAEGDDFHDPAVAAAYERLIGAVRARRAGLDEAFAERLAVWTENASQQAPGDALLIENVLADAVAPFALGGGRPLLLVLDGMSADVAVQLAGELDRRVWTEVVPRPHTGEEPARQAAVSMLPSVTRVSRTALLCGRPEEGGQDKERAGFSAFWKRRQRDGAQLFHKGGYEGPPGHRLAPELLRALASDDIVGVVVNTIDDALTDGREGIARGRWRLGDIAKLPYLLNAARDYGRPVVLVSDHGHVLDRTARGHRLTDAEGAGGARWRTGTAGEGELAFSGPRVRTPGGRVVLPWRDDVRYTARQAGYHGGASLAEVTVPVITIVPSAELVPDGWTLLPAERVAPPWWHGGPDSTSNTAQRPGPAQTAAAVAHSVPRSAAGDTPAPADARARPASQGVARGHASPRGTEPSAQAGIGQRVIDSELYKAQREFVRGVQDVKADRAVAAAIDALVSAGGRLSPGAVVAAAQAVTGRSQRNPERFVTVLERLLNADGYPVVQLVESGRTVRLDKALLEEQFLGEGP